MRANIYQDANGFVTVQYDEFITGDRVRRIFTAPLASGYVQESVGHNWQQVCDHLRSCGPTLIASRETLLGLIRGEYRAMRRDEQREQAKL